jgi:cytochrome c556
MLRYVAIAAALAVGATAVLAQNAASISARKDAMKAIAAAAKDPGGMAKGEIPFDLAKVQASLKVYQEQGAKAKGLFGDDTKAGDTKATAAVWEKKADFDGKFDAFIAAAKAAETAIKDEASFKAEWGKVMGNCGGCHKEYRAAN